MKKTGVFLETLDRSLSSSAKGSGSVLLTSASRYTPSCGASWTTSTFGRFHAQLQASHSFKSPFTLLQFRLYHNTPKHSYLRNLRGAWPGVWS